MSKSAPKGANNVVSVLTVSPPPFFFFLFFKTKNCKTGRFQSVREVLQQKDPDDDGSGGGSGRPSNDRIYRSDNGD